MPDRRRLRAQSECLSGAGAAGLAARDGHPVRAGVPQDRPLGQCRASPSRRRCDPPCPGAAELASGPEGQRVMRSRATAVKVAEAADAVLEWLQTQSTPAGSPPSPPDPAAPAASAVVPDLPAGVRSAGDPEEENASADEASGALPVVPRQDSPEPGDRPDPREAACSATLPARDHAGRGA